VGEMEREMREITYEECVQKVRQLLIKNLFDLQKTIHEFIESESSETVRINIIKGEGKVGH
jgi:hypothetical protein